MSLRPYALAAAFFLCSGIVYAAEAPEVTAFKASMEKMHQGMMIGYTGNTDVDFVRGMIPHHQGAVDMAKIELQYGTDPELRTLAQNIIDSQDEQIGMMQAWLKTHESSK